MVRPTRLDYCQYLPSLRRAVNIPPLQGNQRLKFEQAPAGRQVYPWQNNRRMNRKPMAAKNPKILESCKS